MQVLRGFASASDAKAYLSSELFTQDGRRTLAAAEGRLHVASGADPPACHLQSRRSERFNKRVKRVQYETALEHPSVVSLLLLVLCMASCRRELGPDGAAEHLGQVVAELIAHRTECDCVMEALMSCEEEPVEAC